MTKAAEGYLLETEDSVVGVCMSRLCARRICSLGRLEWFLEAEAVPMYNLYPILAIETPKVRGAVGVTRVSGVVAVRAPTLFNINSCKDNPSRQTLIFSLAAALRRPSFYIQDIHRPVI